MSPERKSGSQQPVQLGERAFPSAARVRAELAGAERVVIARDGSDLTPQEALGVLGGFVLVNDFSARDVQFREMVEGLMGPA